MTARIASTLIALVLLLAVAACSPDAGSVDEGTPPSDDGAAGLRLAPGLYDLEDGSVQALGTLEYRDLEGGIWVIIGMPATEGAEGEIAAVINNPDAFAPELEALEGTTVSVLGTRFDGVSTRMAGPEIVIESIESITDTPGIAE